MGGNPWRLCWPCCSHRHSSGKPPCPLYPQAVTCPGAAPSIGHSPHSCSQIGGRLLASRINERTVAFAGGTLQQLSLPCL